MLTFISIFPHFCTVSKSNIIVCSFCVRILLLNIVCEFHLYCVWVQILFSCCVPLCEYTIIYSLSVLDGHLDSFQCLTIMKCCYEHSRICLFANINMHIFLLYIHVCNYRVIGLSYIQLCKYCQIISQSVLVYKTTNSV